MLANVPTVPGAVVTVASSIPTGADPTKWYQCGSMVTNTWSFDGSTFTAPLNPSPTTPPSAAVVAGSALLAEGIAITSTSTSSLNGTYGLGEISIVNINATMTNINTFGTFFGGTTTMAWLDSAGTEHTFPSINEFKAFASAVGTYVAEVEQYMNSNGTVGTLPTSNAVTIA